MKNYRQQPPYTIQIEPTEGCNLGCSFCGLQGMKHNGKDTLEPISEEIDLFTQAVGEEGYLSRTIVKRPWEKERTL